MAVTRIRQTLVDEEADSADPALRRFRVSVGALLVLLNRRRKSNGPPSSSPSCGQLSSLRLVLRDAGFRIFLNSNGPWSTVATHVRLSPVPVILLERVLRFHAAYPISETSC